MSLWNELGHTAGKIKSFYSATSPATKKLMGRSAVGAAIGGFAAGPDRRGRGMLAGAASGVVSAGGIDHIPSSLKGYTKRGMNWARSKWGK